MKKLILICVLFIGQFVFAQTEYKGQELLERLKGKTLKNYPIATVKGYVSNEGKLTIKIGPKKNYKKFKAYINNNDTDNAKWKKGKSGMSTLTLIQASNNNWKLKDNQGWETPTFYIKDGNYFNY